MRRRAVHLFTVIVSGLLVASSGNAQSPSQGSSWERRIVDPPGEGSSPAGAAAPSQAAPSEAAQSCPDLSPELWSVICQVYEKPKPGNLPYSIDYCCRHYSHEVHNLCAEYGLQCRTVNFNCGEDFRHSINLVENPPGTCFLIDITGGESKVSPFSFPCKDFSVKHICRLYSNKTDCACVIERTSSQPIDPDNDGNGCVDQVKATQPWFKSMIEPPFEVCTRCCHLMSKSFWLDSKPEDRAQVAAAEIRCLRSCADEFDPSRFSADLGMWYAYNKCLGRHEPSIHIGPLPYNHTAAECLACCSDGAGHAGLPGEYPTEQEASCRKTCKDHLGDSPGISPVSPAPKTCSTNCVDCCKKSAQEHSSGSEALRDATYSLCFKRCSCPGGTNLPFGEPRFGKSATCNSGSARR